MGIKLFDCSVGESGQLAAVEVLRSGNIAMGEYVAALEIAVAKMVPESDVVAIGNLTQAIEIALRTCGVGRDDEVVTLAFNCLQSNAAISAVGASPVWVDVDPSTGAVDLDDLRKNITDRTKAVVIYHIAGYPGDIHGVRKICDEFGIPLIEDANAALGAILDDGQFAGAVGDFAVYSFYANRLINGCEGAVLICKDRCAGDIARRLRRMGIDQSTFRDQGGEINPLSDILDMGISATMNNVNAAVALDSFSSYERRLSRVRKNAAHLQAGLRSFPEFKLVEPVGRANPSYWVLMVITNERDAVLDRLRRAGIGCTKLHAPNYIYSCFSSSARLLLGTEEFSKKMFGLPVGWWLDIEDMDSILTSLCVRASQ